MADNTLRATIALDGADDIKKQFDAIAQSGKQAGQQIGDAISGAQSAITGFFASFERVFSGIAGVGKDIAHAFDPFVEAAGAARADVAKLGAAFGAITGAAAGVTGAIGKIGQDAANSISKLNDAAEVAGLTLEKFRALKAGAAGVGVSEEDLKGVFDDLEKLSRDAELSGKTVGRWLHAGGGESALGSGGATDRRGGAKWIHMPQSDADGSGADAEGEADGVEKLGDAADKAGAAIGALGEGLRGFNREITNGIGVIRPAADALGEHQSKFERMAAAMRALGVSLTDAYNRARPREDLFNDTINGLARYADGARRTQLAVDAFGEGRAKNLLALADERAQLEANRAAVERAGAAFSDVQKKTIADARATGATLAAVKQSWLDYYGALATPVTVDQNKSILSFFEENRAAIKDFGDNVVGPAVRWLGQFKNAFGATAIAAGSLGAALGLLSPLTATIFGAAGAAAIAFGDQIKNGAVAAMTELTRIVKTNDLSTFAGWKNGAKEVWEDIKSLVAEAWTDVKQKIQATDWRAVWESVKAGAREAWEGVKTAATEAYQTIKSSLLSSFPELTEPWNAVEAGAKKAWGIVKEFVTAIPGAFKKIMEVADQVAGVINGIFGTHFTGATLIATALIAQFASSLIPIPGWLQALAVAVAPIAGLFTTMVAAVRGAGGAIDFVLGKVQALTDWLSDKLVSALRSVVGEDIWGSWESTAEGAIGAIRSALDKLAGAARAAWEAITGAGQSKDPSGSANAINGATYAPDHATIGDGQIIRSWTPGYASGGLLSGAGTGTSDSMIARVSNGEYIQTAKATKGWGAPFMDAVNSLNIKGVVDELSKALGGPRALFGALGGLGDLKLPGFASGGEVGGDWLPRFELGGFASIGAPAPIALPRFAEGGAASSAPTRGDLVSFPLEIGGSRFEVISDEQVARALQRHSVRTQINSAWKRAPSWYR